MQKYLQGQDLHSQSSKYELHVNTETAFMT